MAETMKNAVFWDVMPRDLVRTDVSEERIASIIRVTIRSSKTSVLTKATRRNISENDILHSYRREEPQMLRSINRPSSVAEA
jgi:hypothetical protein